MNLAINFVEPTTCNYLYIDEQNAVHLMLPFVGGDEIGLDNTCRTASELNTFFFGKNTTPSAERTLELYLAGLQNDLDRLAEAIRNDPFFLTYKTLREEKAWRATQITLYLHLIRVLKSNLIPNAQIPALNNSFSQLPEAMLQLLRGSTNAGAICLAPLHRDSQTRFRHNVFSLRRESFSNLRSLGLGGRLWRSFMPHQRGTQFQPQVVLQRCTAKDRLVRAVQNRIGTKRVTASQNTAQSISFPSLKQIIQEELRRLEPEICLDKTLDGSVLDFTTLTTQLCYDETDPLNDWITGIIGLGVSDAFWDQRLDSVFYDGPQVINTQNEADQLSIKVQFFIGETNIYCYVHQLSAYNFGEFFDREAIATALAERVKQGLNQGQAIEPLILSYINQHYRSLGLSAPLDAQHQSAITAKFNQHYNTIKGSPHFDEFLIAYPDRPGSLYSHQGRICCHFLDFYSRLAPLPALSPAMQTTLSVLSVHKERLEQSPTHRLNHKNAIIEASPKAFHIQETVLNTIESDAATLAVYLMESDASNRPHYTLLSAECREFILHHPSWPSIKEQINAQPAMRAVQKELFLAAFSPHKLRQAIQSNRIWAEYSAKPLLHIELDKIARGLKDITEAYDSKRTKTWWKGRRNRTRLAQCASLVRLAEDINTLLSSPALSESTILLHLFSIISHLSQLDDEIAREKNLYASQLQLEIRQFKVQLTQLCAITAGRLPTTLPADPYALYHQNQCLKVRHPIIRAIVQRLPTRCQSNDYIAFFNTLSREEALKVAPYLNLNYRPLNANVDKTQLLKQALPATYKRFNLAFLTQNMKEGQLPQRNYDELCQVAHLLPPALMNAKTLPLWKSYKCSDLQDITLSYLDNIHPDELSLEHIEGLNALADLGIRREELHANAIDIVQLGNEKLSLKNRAICRLINRVQPANLSEKMKHALKLATTLLEDGYPAYIKLPIETNSGHASTFTPPLPLVLDDLERCLRANPGANIVSAAEVDLDYLNRLLMLREAYLLFPS